MQGQKEGRNGEKKQSSENRPRGAAKYRASLWHPTPQLSLLMLLVGQNICVQNGLSLKIGQMRAMLKIKNKLGAGIALVIICIYCVSISTATLERRWAELEQGLSG